jgi:SOS response regulatory protein OraA/RecX
MARLTIEHDPAGTRTATPRRHRSVTLRLDGEGWLRVEPETIAELPLADGDDIDDRRRAELETALTSVRAHRFVVQSLAGRMQSTAELRRKLARRGIPGAIARDAIERAAGHGYVDDTVLAGQLARGMLSRGYGRRRAEETLRARGLLGPLAAAALAEAYEGQDEPTLAREALGRRPVATDADRRRALSFLARRGFSPPAARAAVRAAAAEWPTGAGEACER